MNDYDNSPTVRTPSALLDLFFASAQLLCHLRYTTPADHEDITVLRQVPRGQEWQKPPASALKQVSVS